MAEKTEENEPDDRVCFKRKIQSERSERWSVWRAFRVFRVHESNMLTQYFTVGLYTPTPSEQGQLTDAHSPTPTSVIIVQLTC